MKASSMRRTGVRTLSTGCFSDVAPEQLAPEGARARSAARGSAPARARSSVSEMVSRRDRAVGTAHRAMELQVERAEGRDRHRRHPLHHHRQRLAHGDRRIDVDPAGGRQRGQQLELLGDRIEPALDHRDLARRSRWRRGRPAAARRCRWRRPAPRCRRCPRSAPARRTPAPAPRSAAGGRDRAAAPRGADRHARSRRAGHGSVGRYRRVRASLRPCREAKGPRDRSAAVDQAAARIAALLTLPSTWPSNCWKFFSKRWATSRAALS